MALSDRFPKIRRLGLECKLQLIEGSDKAERNFRVSISSNGDVKSARKVGRQIAMRPTPICRYVQNERVRAICMYFRPNKYSI